MEGITGPWSISLAVEWQEYDFMFTPVFFFFFFNFSLPSVTWSKRRGCTYNLHLLKHFAVYGVTHARIRHHYIFGLLETMKQEYFLR